jgi:hypothetical protein
MIDKTNTEIVVLILLFWIFNSAVFTIVPMLVAICVAIVGPFVLLKVV